MATAQLRHEWRHVNGVELHCVVAGEGPLVVLLHGFPEFWYSWRHQIPALTEHFTVVAPDMRGYNLSSKPDGVANYVVPTLVEDVADLIKSFGQDQAHVVGHDWGGAITWAVGMLRPDVVKTLSILNAPHPRLFTQHILTNAQQRSRSWYMAFFQLPWLPEMTFSSNNYRLIEQAFRANTKHPEHFPDEAISAYKEAAAQPGALTAMINYYRGIMRPASQRVFMEVDPVLQMPVQVIWGVKDFALGKELNDNLERYVPNLRLDFVQDASHWVQQDQPELVTDLLLDFLNEHK